MVEPKNLMTLIPITHTNMLSFFCASSIPCFRILFTMPSLHCFVIFNVLYLYLHISLPQILRKISYFHLDILREVKLHSALAESYNKLGWSMDARDVLETALRMCKEHSKLETKECANVSVQLGWIY